MFVTPEVAAELDRLADSIAALMVEIPEAWSTERLMYEQAFQAAIDADYNVTNAREYANEQARPGSLELRRLQARLGAATHRYDHLRWMVDHPLT